jgi:hypothetical protein
MHGPASASGGGSIRAPRFALAFALAGLVAAIASAGPAEGHHGGSIGCGDGCAKIPLLFDPAVSPVPAKPSGTQPGEEWDGTAPAPDPLGVTQAADIREFQVLSGNDSLAVEIKWDPGFALSYDLDLFVDRMTDSGEWEQVGDSTNGQLLGEGEPVELAVVQAPTAGTYRTRVVNWASTEFAYHGTLWFTAGTKSGGGGKKPAAGGRATADRPDIVDGSKIHVIYFVPSDAQDNQLDVNGVLENSVASMNTFLEQDIGRRLRLDTYLDRRTPRLDVSFVLGERTASEYSQDPHPDGTFGAVTEELEHRGWTESGAVKRYFVYYEGPAESANICGTAYLNITGGFAQWSVVWLGASPGCGARDFGTPETGGGMSEAIALHENFHNEGMVPLEALHQCWAFSFHLCSAAAGAAVSSLDPENIDLLFPFVTFPLRDKVVDRDRDDYYDHPFLHRDMVDSPFWEN